MDRARLEFRAMSPRSIAMEKVTPGNGTDWTDQPKPPFPLVTLVGTCPWYFLCILKNVLKFFLSTFKVAYL